jgi:hypothetical protein
MRAGTDHVDEKLASCQPYLQVGLGAKRTVIEGDIKSEKLPEKPLVWFTLDPGGGVLRMLPIYVKEPCVLIVFCIVVTFR